MALNDDYRLAVACYGYYKVSSWICKLFADLCQRYIKEQQPIYIFEERTGEKNGRSLLELWIRERWHGTGYMA